MAQLTIYIDDKSLRKIEAAAKRAKSSVSRWVKSKLDEALSDAWPQGYFELFGKLRSEPLTRPKQPPWAKDSKREKI